MIPVRVGVDASTSGPGAGDVPFQHFKTGSSVHRLVRHGRSPLHSPRAEEALLRARRSLVDAGVPDPIQSPENELCSEVERRLRQYLAPRIPDVPTFNLEDVVQLCRRQWERGELSPTRLDEATAGRVCAEPYVQDRIRIARFLASESEAGSTSGFPA